MVSNPACTAPLSGAELAGRAPIGAELSFSVGLLCAVLAEGTACAAQIERRKPRASSLL